MTNGTDHSGSLVRNDRTGRIAREKAVEEVITAISWCELGMPSVAEHSLVEALRLAKIGTGASEPSDETCAVCNLPHDVAIGLVIKERDWKNDPSVIVCADCDDKVDDEVDSSGNLKLSEFGQQEGSA